MVRLRVDAIASVHLNALAIIEDYPLSVLLEDMGVQAVRCACLVHSEATDSIAYFP